MAWPSISSEAGRLYRLLAESSVKVTLRLVREIRRSLFGLVVRNQGMAGQVAQVLASL